MGVIFNKIWLQLTLELTDYNPRKFNQKAKIQCLIFQFKPLLSDRVTLQAFLPNWQVMKALGDPSWISEYLTLKHQPQLEEVFVREPPMLCLVVKKGL